MSGDLAVSNFGNGLGFVQIFKHAKANIQHTYSSNVCAGPAALGYDNKGNLFIEAYNYASRVIICELPSRSGWIQVDSFDSTIDLPGGVMWDGKFVMIADRESVGHTNLYQVKSPHKGFVKTVGTTTLTGQGCRASSVFEPFVVGARNTPASPPSRPAARRLIGKNIALACHTLKAVAGRKGRPRRLRQRAVWFALMPTT